MTEEVAKNGEFAPFHAPELQYNEEGWGPSQDIQEDFIYQPFSKSDRLGKISDWTGTATQDKKFMSKCFFLCDSKWNINFHA